MGKSMPAPASLPEGRRIYAIGDVHGCLDRLVALHASIARDLRDRPVASSLLIHLGDYVDRGADSAGVIRLLRAGFAAAPSINLMGNHEQMMIAALDGFDPASFVHWTANGGRAALRSWGVPEPYALEEARRLVPAEDRTFIHALRPYHREGGYFFVHAGIRPGVPLNRQSAYDLLWIREPFLSWAGPLDAVVVHGHTPMDGPVVKTNRIGIDTGAVLGGPLTCVALEREELRFLFA
jgi:serine/threonine protein phosphatase 1